MSEWIRSCGVRKGFPGARGSAVFALALALALTGQGCSDDSSGGTLVDPCLDFTGPAPASGSVTTRLGDDSTCLLATLEIVATGIDDVWALSTTVTFDPAVAAYGGYSITGSVLGSDGTALTPAVQLTDEGLVTVGVSRVAALEGIDIDENGGVLVQLFFALSSTVASSGSLTMGDECLQTVDPLAPGDPPEVIPGVTCSGGTLVIQ